MLDNESQPIPPTQQLSGTALRHARYELSRLGDFADIAYGIAKSPANRPGIHARPYLRVANVQKGALDLTQVKLINVPEHEFETYRLSRDDLLDCEGNSADLVGRPAIWNNEITDCVHQNHLLRVRVDPTVALPHFVLEYMHTPPSRNHFRARAKFSTNLASINSSDLRDLKIPLPPLAIQQKIIGQVEVGRAEIARAREAAERLVKEINNELETLIFGIRTFREILCGAAVTS